VWGIINSLKTLILKRGWPFFLFSAASILLVAAGFLALFLRDQVRGDLVVQSLIHLKDFSIYFWGQDRYFSLVPLLLLWNKRPELGLYLTTLLNAVSFFLVPYLLLAGLDSTRGASVDSMGKLLWQRFAVLAFYAISVAVLWSTEELYFFVKDASPFPLSTALGFGSVLVWLQGVQVRSFSFPLPDFWRLLLSGGFIVLSLAVAPTTFGLSTVFLLSLLLASDLGFGRQRRIVVVFRQVCGYLLVSFVAWLLIQCADVVFRIPKLADYSRLGSIDALSALGQSVSVISLERMDFSIFWGPRLAIFCSLAVVGLFAPPRLVPFLGPRRIPLSLGPAALFWIYGMVCLIAFSNIGWVEQNGFHFRYQYPLYVAWSCSCLLSLRWLLSRTVVFGDWILSRFVQRLVLLAMGCLMVASVSCRPLMEGALSVRAAQPIYTWLKASQISVVGGDYWSVWPLYLWSHRKGSSWLLHSVAHRSSSNFASHDWIRAYVKHQFQEGRSVEVACLGDANQRSCVAQFQEVIQAVDPASVATIQDGSTLPAGVSLIKISSSASSGNPKS